MIARNPDDRLCGAAAKEHPFLEPLNELWDDVAALKHPPFPRGLVPEYDADTRLDLRAYSGEDSEDSLVGSTADCAAALADIPFDDARSDIGAEDAGTLPDSGPSVCELPVSGDLATGSGVASSSPAVSDVDNSTHSVSALPSYLEWSLSMVPTIPSYCPSADVSPIFVPPADTQPEVSPRIHTMFEYTQGLQTPPVSKHLRRQPIVYDLRQAFEVTHSKDPAKPKSISVHLPTSMELRRPSTSRRGRAVEAGSRRTTVNSKRRLGSHSSAQSPSLLSPTTATASAGWGFEQEITIALLATMSERTRTPRHDPGDDRAPGHPSRRTEKPSTSAAAAASVATLQQQRAGVSGAGKPGHGRSIPHGSRRSGPASTGAQKGTAGRTRARVQTALRAAVKGLVSVF